MNFAPIYLDWNATTPLDPAVREAMLPWLGAAEPARFGNASSRHEYGRQARAAVDEARARVAAAVGAHATEVIFTSGGSEANNLFLKGAVPNLKPGVVAVSAIEHPCVREPARQLRRAGWTLREIAVDAQGVIDPADWSAVLEARPGLVSVMLANNETGVLQDVAALARAKSKRSATAVDLRAAAIWAGVAARICAAVMAFGRAKRRRLKSAIKPGPSVPPEKAVIVFSPGFGQRRREAPRQGEKARPSIRQDPRCRWPWCRWRERGRPGSAGCCRPRPRSA